VAASVVLQPTFTTAAAAPIGSIAGFALLVAGVAIVVVGACAVWNMVRRPSGGARKSPCEPATEGRSPRLSSVACEAEELAERLAERVEMQASRLEELISEADARLRKLETMCKPPTAAARGGVIAEPRPFRASPSSNGADPLSQRVYGLADQGLPAVEIARRLEEQIGKVELILALRNA
jgi:hypothetical protein